MSSNSQFDGENQSPVVIYGASGHGKVIADLLATSGVEVAGFVDDGESMQGQNLLGLPVLGNGEWLISQDDFSVALGIGDNLIRRVIAKRCVDGGLKLISAIHPRAIVAPSAKIEAGVVIMASAVVNPEACIGQGAVINSSAVVEHDCQVGAFAHLSPNAAMAGGAKVGELAHMGIGASVLPLVNIGANTSVGGGACVINDLPDNVVAVGVPARILKTKETP